MTEPTVETYSLHVGNGRRTRMATRVRFPDGTIVSFTERVSRKSAIRRAMAVAGR